MIEIEDLKCKKENCEDCDCVNAKKGLCDKCTCDCENYSREEDCNDEDYISEEELNDIVENIIKDKLSVKLDITNLDGCAVNKDKFQQGIDSISEYCGKVSALKSIGMSEDNIVALLVNDMAVKSQENISQNTSSLMDKMTV